MSQLTIYPYSEKSIAVFGDIDRWRTHLTSLGIGSENKHLRGPNNAITHGFIYPKNLEFKVRELVNSINSGSVSSDSPAPPVDINTKRPRKTNVATTMEDTFVLSKTQYLDVISRLERVENELVLFKSMIENGNTATRNSVSSNSQVSSSKTNQQTPIFHFIDDDMEDTLDDPIEEDDDENVKRAKSSSFNVVNKSGDKVTTSLRMKTKK